MPLVRFPVLLLLIQRSSWLLGRTIGCAAWLHPQQILSSSRPRPTRAIVGRTEAGAPVRLGTSLGSSDGDSGDWSSTLQRRIEEQTRGDLVRAVMGHSVPLTNIQLVGQAHVPAGRRGAPNRNIPCAVLSTASWTLVSSHHNNDEPQPCLLVPLSSSGRFGGAGGGLKLLEFAVHRQLLSKSLLLQLNGLLVNRDNGLFDNVPWAGWTVDPHLRNRDAANNPVDPKFHLGKRDAYHRMMGKDWQGKSLALKNLAQRLRHALEEDEDPTDRPHREPGGEEDEEDAASLAERIVRLQIKEQAMIVADLDYQLAICRQRRKREQEEGGSTNEDATRGEESDDAVIHRLLNDREVALKDLQSLRQQLEELSSDGTTSDGRSRASFALAQLLNDLAKGGGDDKEKAPYRGATGYAPRVDSFSEVRDSLTGMYCSPYDLFKEILSDQLNAEVIGAVLENTSLLEGTLAVGGAVVLRRKTARKSVTIDGEQISVNDSDEDYGNIGITGGETVLVECDADEAIGLALACDVPLQVESSIAERGSVMMQRISAPVDDPTSAATVRDALPVWGTRDPLLSVLVAGQATNESATGRAAPLRIPRTTASLYDSLFEQRASASPSSRPRPMFPTDNPIQSLDEYDQLTIEGKARTLMTMSNFEGQLPRPRVVRESPEVLDQLLLPLIDESTRRQYRIREARRSGDEALAQELEREKSPRQLAQEKAELARQVGADLEAERWEQEAKLYASLRADVTQDEGSYSRFLDRDEWYERQRAQQAKKLDRRKFGTLLDGME